MQRVSSEASLIAGYNASFAATNLEKDHAQYDIRIRLLALLAHLSNSGVDGSAANWKEDIARRRERLEAEEAEKADDKWSSALRDGTSRKVV